MAFLSIMCAIACKNFKSVNQFIFGLVTAPFTK